MSFLNAMCELALMEKEASHCHISADATYSLPREAIQKNHLRMITHMEKWSYLMYFFQNICSYFSSNPSALLSSLLGADSLHTNIHCHWNQLTPGQQTQGLEIIFTTSKKKCRSYKNHPNSCICTASDTLDATYQTPFCMRLCGRYWTTILHQSKLYPW